MEGFYDFINYYFLLGVLFIAYLIYRILHTLFFSADFIHTKYKLKGHSWRNIQCNKSIPYSIYCNVCSALMLPLVGLFCECCGACACKKCHNVIDANNKCKQITSPKDKPFYHLWVNVGAVSGRAPTDRADDVSCITKYFCSWCQRTKVSKANLCKSTELCDFQKYRSIIIPPQCVVVEKGRITRIREFAVDNWEPLIIFANLKSGSYKGHEVLSIFRGVLNPIQLPNCFNAHKQLYHRLRDYKTPPNLTQPEEMQTAFSSFTSHPHRMKRHNSMYRDINIKKVIDIASIPPERALKWLPPRCRILVAGGDGTIAWVLNALHGSTRVKASVGILPMGTGNDLSRSLGWGPGNTDLDAHAIINDLLQANEILLDRWKVTIKPKGGRLGRLRSEQVLFAYNYASVGVDAQVALDFHRARSQFLYRYANRTLNYMAYAILGVGRVLDAGACDALERRLRVWTCGVELALPPLQGLVLLNIPTWGAGVQLWKLGSDDDVGEQLLDDGKLEVVGISSSFHIARLQCGLAEPYRFAQASYVKIELNGRCAMQVDGEPWMQGPATITVEPAGQSCVLRANSTRTDT